MEQRSCPKCGRLWPSDANFCGECRTRLGAPAEASGQKAEDEREKGVVLLWVMDLFPGVFSPTTLLMSLAGLGVSIFIGFFAVLVFSMGAMLTAFPIGAAGVIMYWTALSWLLIGYVCLPTEAMAEFQGKHWTVFMLMTVVPLGLFFLLAGLASG